MRGTRRWGIPGQSLHSKSHTFNSLYFREATELSFKLITSSSVLGIAFTLSALSEAQWMCWILSSYAVCFVFLDGVWAKTAPKVWCLRNWVHTKTFPTLKNAMCGKSAKSCILQTLCTWFCGCTWTCGDENHHLKRQNFALVVTLDLRKIHASESLEGNYLIFAGEF